MAKDLHTTNYFNTFIEVADDCPVNAAEVPPLKGDNRTAANIQFRMIVDNPYQFTSDDILFSVFAEKNEVTSRERAAERERFFSKGQPCLRSSPLGKRYGWGVHFDAEGRVAIYAIDSEEYRKFAGDKSLQHVKAMRSKRA